MGGSFGRWFGYTDRSVACAEEAGLLRHVSDCDPEAIRLERRLHHLLGTFHDSTNLWRMSISPRNWRRRLPRLIG